MGSWVSGKIDSGLLVYLAVHGEDDREDLEWIVKKILGLRIFDDENDRMNLPISDAQGILVVSQFTLAADTSRGNRPGFSYAAHPEKGEKLYEYFTQQLQNQNIICKKGVFGGDMKVSLVNDGPITIWLDNKT